LDLFDFYKNYDLNFGAKCEILNETDFENIFFNRVDMQRIKGGFLGGLGGVKIFFIDYIQLLNIGEKANKTRADQLGEVTAYLKKICLDSGMSCIVLSQLTREKLSANSSKKPDIRDLKDSSRLSHDADLVLLLDYPYFISKEKGKEREATLIIAKNRWGKQGEIGLDFSPDCGAYAKK